MFQISIPYLQLRNLVALVRSLKRVLILGKIWIYDVAHPLALRVIVIGNYYLLADGMVQGLLFGPGLLDFDRVSVRGHRIYYDYLLLTTWF